MMDIVSFIEETVFFTFFQLEEGRIIVLLKKKDDISWTEYMMSEHGLETDIKS
jgi:hypothetical protein